MSNSIEKMKQNGFLVEIHPGGEADIPRLNELLRLHDEYIDGIEFTYAKKLGGNQVQFCYDHPDTFTKEQAEIAQRIVSEVKNKFMATK
ncbi:hypothetical protein ACJO1Z_23060 [Vibrio parahaemolyticus]|uniref:hypothetical protein n=1 Tax=Vibrio parahaemolyticus TaxID=670 RepID=UPI00387AEC7C|nr:hypothetical protein [Vibrio parahaemolyticus]